MAGQLTARLPRAFIVSRGPVSTSAYVKAVKRAKANPDARFPEGLTCWWPCTGAEIVQQFRAGLHDRINQRPGVPMA